MKSVTVGKEKLDLTPIRLEGPLGGFPDTEYYLASDDSIVLVKNKKVTHRFPADSPNRKVMQYQLKET